MSDTSDDPKIHVDEDWKERVRAEREAGHTTRTESESSPSGGYQAESPPPDHFAMLVTTLAAEAMIALGQAPDPAQGHPVVRPELARHSIDMLAMLERKTQGNLTPNEAKMLSDVLHQLRMLFLAVYRSPDAEASRPAPGAEDAAKPSSEEG